MTENKQILKLQSIIKKNTGIDRAIGYVLLGRGFSVLAQPITLYLIARYFTGVEQGFYYTFGSLLAISVFLELGLGIVITQFASHEYAYLRWKDDGGLDGEPKALSRLLSLMRKSLGWYGVITVIYALLLIPIGIWFFSTSSDSFGVHYVMPWIILVIFSAAKLSVLPIQSVLEGCGRVAAVQRLILMQSVLGGIVVIVTILSNGKLLAASFLAISNFAIVSVWLWRNFKGFLVQIFATTKVALTHHIRWKTEILPMQWRIALSWMSGYLIYQLFNPLLFKYQSPEIAGRMGMSLSLANMMQNVSIAWLSTKVPLYGALISKKDYKTLNQLFKKSTIQSLIVSIIISFAAIAAVWSILYLFPKYSSRILPVPSVAMLLFANVINILIVSFAGYLRAHKEEPFLIPSLIGAACTATAAWVCAKYFNANVLCAIIFVLNLTIGLPMAYYVFRKKQKDWNIVP